MTADPLFAWFNGIFLLLISLVPVITLMVTRNHEWGDVRAHKYSLKARLPFGSDVVAISVRRHLRFVVRTRMWVLLALLAGISVLYVALPFRSSPLFLWVFIFSALALGLPAASVFASLRERMFDPAPTAVRIARTRELGVADYLGPLRRLTPPVLLLAAAIAVVALAALTALLGRRIDMAILVMSAASLAMAVVAAAIGRVVERMVLERPQPASNTIELAWDDSFRSDTLGWLRLGAATTAVIPLGIAGSTLVATLMSMREPELIGVLALFPWWGAISLQLLYQFGEGHMPKGLYPAQLGARPPLTVAEAFA